MVKKGMQSGLQSNNIPAVENMSQVQQSTDSALCDTYGPNMNGAVKGGLKVALKRARELQIRRELSTPCGAETKQPSLEKTLLIV